MLEASTPVFIAALILGAGRMIVGGLRSSDPEYRRGIGMGGVVFLGAWVLTTAMGCGWSITHMKF
jgi:hypothetical protein